MQLLQSLFSIRSKQLVRALQALSWYHVPVLCAALAFLFFWLFHKLQDAPFAILAVVAATALVLLLHTSRSDKKFLQHLSQRHQLIMWVEYSILTLPIHALLLLAGQWQLVIALEASLLLISYFKVSLSFKVKAVAYPFIYRQNFEWKAGVRQSQWPLLAIYTLGVVLVPYPFATLFMLWLLLVLISSFYQEHEPYTLLLLPEKGPKQFLKYKIRLHLLQFIVLTFPLLFLYLVFHLNHAILALAAYTMLLLVLISCILLKYAYYEPNEKLTSAASLLNALHLASPLLPFLLFFPLISSIRNYRKAIHRLSPFLYDFNQ